MLTLYNLFLPILQLGVKVAALFSSKIRRGLEGRRGLLSEIQKHYSTIASSRLRILVHSASYGELEQAKPIITALRKKYPSAHIHLTFFSPSGYENTRKLDGVDFISYSPVDTRGNVSRFLDLVKPSISLFTRYDVWPNMANELHKRGIPSVLFAATAAESSRRMLPLSKALHTSVYKNLSKILTIGEQDEHRFNAMGVTPKQLVVAGDTRFDQVIARQRDVVAQGAPIIPDPIWEQIQSKGSLVFIIGSSWPADEAIVKATIAQSVERSDNIVTIIVPHEPSEERLRSLLALFPSKAIRLSQIGEYAGEPVIIVDSIGKLFGLYRYADVAMIGGGFGQGLHNVLEAAVWGIPAIVGPRHKKSQEVQLLIDQLAAFEVTSASEFDFVFWQLAKDDDLRATAGKKEKAFVEENQGATERIMTEIETLLQDRS